MFAQLLLTYNGSWFSLSQRILLFALKEVV